MVTWVSLAPKIISKGHVITKATTPQQDRGPGGNQQRSGPSDPSILFWGTAGGGGGASRCQDAACQAGPRSTQDELILYLSFPTSTSQHPNPQHPLEPFPQRPGRGLEDIRRKPNDPCVRRHLRPKSFYSFGVRSSSDNE